MIWRNVRQVPAHALRSFIEKLGKEISDYAKVDRSFLQIGAAEDASDQVVLYHVAALGFVAVPRRIAAALLDGAAIAAEDRALVDDVRRACAKLGWSDEPPTAAQLARRITDFPAIQNTWELERFVELVTEARPRVVVEIGTGHGGTLFCFAQAAASDALLVSIDIPLGRFLAGHTTTDGDECEVEVFRSFCRPGQTMRFVRDRASPVSSKWDLEAILEGRPIDLLFIDGDHAYGAVKSDFEMYSPLVGKGGLVAFHDVRIEPTRWGRGFDVKVFWDEVKAQRPSREIVDPRGRAGFDWSGGVQPALGIGILQM